MELILAIVGALFIIGIIVAVIGTLAYLSEHPESELQRHHRISKRGS